MKHLVTKIALPGAILACAMALSGGTAYAFTKWESTNGAVNLQKTSDHIVTLEGRINKLISQKSDSEQRITTMNAEIVELTAVNDKLNGELKTIEVQRLSESAESQNEIAGLKSKIEENNKAIKKLTGDISSQERWMTAKTNEVTRLRGQVASLETELSEKRAEVNQLTDAIKHTEKVQKQAEDAVKRTEAVDKY